MLAALLATALGPPVLAQENPVVGTNLAPVGSGSTQWPFADFLKSAEGWRSVGGALEVDANGDILSGSAERSLFTGTDGRHPVGPFTLTWTGSGKFEFAGPGKVAESTTGRIVFDADIGDGLTIRVSEVDPKDPPRNVHFRAPDAGEAMHPVFLQKLGLYRVLRFADWTRAATSPVAKWEDRPLPSFASYAGPTGVPWEVCFSVAQAQRAGAWISVPFAADDAYVSALAELARSHVASGLTLYVEYSTEPWDASTPAGAFSVEQAKALGPDARRSAMRAAAERSVQVFQTFERVLGGRTGLVRVLAVPFGDVEAATDLLAWQTVGRSVDALAVPAWFGAGERSEQDLDSLFAALDAEVEGRWAAGVKAMAALAKRNRLALLASTGGQRLENDPADEAKTLLLDEANRDPRMRETYLKALKVWRTAGAGLFVHAADCAPIRAGRRPGALEFQMQESNRAPKHSALLQYALFPDR